MTRPVIGTIAARGAIAAMNLLLVAVAARSLGLADVGRMSLVVLAITLVLLLCHVVGGGGLVYLEPRHGTRTLRWVSYGWAALACAASGLLIGPLGLAPPGLGSYVTGLAFLQALHGIHLSLLLGRERFGAQNALQVGRTITLITAFAVLLRIGDASLMDFIHATAIADAATVVVSGALLARLPAQSSDPARALIALIRQGLPAQAANTLQLLTYRLSYYLLQNFQGAAALGLWSISTQLAESAWLAPKSLGSVLYAKVSNLQERDRQRDLTLAVMKASMAIAALTAGVLMLLPEVLFEWVFGPEAKGVGRLVMLMAPGLLAMAGSQALSHFMSGSGRVLHNTIGSALGLVATLAIGYTLIPERGADGAAITASAAYTLAVIYQYLVFKRITGARLKHVLPNRLDGERIAKAWRRFAGG